MIYGRTKPPAHDPNPSAAFGADRFGTIGNLVIQGG
jgi:hypothetical protein